MSMSAEKRVEHRPGNSARPSTLPVIHYWEVIWNRLHQDGWKLTHTTWSSPETDGVRHYVSAQRRGEWLEHSTPSMTETMTKISRAALESERANAAQAFRTENTAQ